MRGGVSQLVRLWSMCVPSMLSSHHSSNLKHHEQTSHNSSRAGLNVICIHRLCFDRTQAEVETSACEGPGYRDSKIHFGAFERQPTCS